MNSSSGGATHANGVNVPIPVQQSFVVSDCNCVTIDKEARGGICPTSAQQRERARMLAGKVALVTGAGAGIGRAVALGLAQQGAQVVVNDLGSGITGEGASVGPAQETVEMIRAVGGTAVTSTDSVASWDSAQRIVGLAHEAFGGLDIVVNNAGIMRRALFHETPPEDWDAVINVHLSGMFYVSRAAVGPMMARGGGSYIHMTSTSGLMGNLDQVPYCAAKAGIVGLSRAIALEMRDHNIRSNCIAPFASTRMATTLLSHDRSDAKDAMRALLAPEQIAPLACYLASDRSAHVSGQVFTVRRNEIMIMQQGLPRKCVHRSEGWTAETVADHAMPALESEFTPLKGFKQLMAWAPV